MAQQLKALTSFLEDLGMTPSINMVVHANSGGHSALYWPLQALHAHGIHTYTGKHSNT